MLNRSFNKTCQTGDDPWAETKPAVCFKTHSSLSPCARSISVVPEWVDEESTIAHLAPGWTVNPQAPELELRILRNSARIVRLSVMEQCEEVRKIAPARRGDGIFQWLTSSIYASESGSSGYIHILALRIGDFR